jgi:hypothetical protein
MIKKRSSDENKMFEIYHFLEKNGVLVTSREYVDVFRIKTNNFSQIVAILSDEGYSLTILAYENDECVLKVKETEAIKGCSFRIGNSAILEKVKNDLTLKK